MDLFTEKYHNTLKSIGILPVVCLKNEKELNTFLNAVLKSEIRCVEITLRHPFSLEAIGYIKKNHPEITVGAGTVKNTEVLKSAMDYGADFGVAPGTLDEILETCEKLNFPFLPGCATPSEFMKLSLLGYETVKFFPAECSGGVKALKLYEGAFSELSFIPTGGIDMTNFASYASLKNVIACGGSFMAPSVLIEEDKSLDILSRINELMRIHKEVKI